MSYSGSGSGILRQRRGKAMERGVYVAEFGEVTEIAAVDRDGRVLKRVSVRSDLYEDGEADALVRWLDQAVPRRDGPNLRLM